MPKPLFEQFKEVIQTTKKSEHLLNSESLHDLFDYLNEKANEIQKLNGAVSKDIAFATWGKELLNFEKRSKDKEDKPWRFCFDAPYSQGKYVGDPVIQVCSGSPDYHRFAMTFNKDKVDINFDIQCVTAKPDLTVIKSRDGKKTLAERKIEDDQNQIQRIAILGAARMFIHDTNPKKEHLELTDFCEKQLNRFSDVFMHADPSRGKNEPVNRFRLVNGGWGGFNEGSTGLPLISNLAGVMSQKEDGSIGRRPMTVMPRGGAYDAVLGVEDFNYYEVPGTWGDDSKYLVGYSTAVVAFAPYGFWTEIELRNAIAQGKPTVVIANQKKLDELNLPISPEELKKLKGSIKHSTSVTVDLPNNEKGSYRIFTDAATAAVWINRCWNVKFLEEFLRKNSLDSKDEINIVTKINTLKSNYLKENNPIHFGVLLRELKAQIPEFTREIMNEALKQHAWGYFKDNLKKKLINDLNKYKEYREKDAYKEYLKKNADSSRLFSQSSSKQEEFEAINQLIEFLNGSANYPKSHEKVFLQGYLGSIVKAWEAETTLRLMEMGKDIPNAFAYRQQRPPSST